ncbi:MAG TPA: SIMPL domain-containing protein [Allosphingosinicella sp.]|nr:SIMPL domain-containing protein [Allosphingosinicella sp.]
MRLAGLAVALAAVLACPGSAAAQSQPASLAPGETLLEVAAVGKVRNPADVALLYVLVKSDAGSAAEARAANAVRVDRVKAAAKSSRVETVDVRPAAAGWRVGFVGDAAPEMSLPTALRPATKTETAMLEIRLADPAGVESVRTAVEKAGADEVTGPVYELADDSAARRAARQDAIDRARAEADDYARALGMRVVRIVRVSERAILAPDPEDMEALYAAMGLGNSSSREIETRVRIAVDFALAQAR